MYQKNKDEIISTSELTIFIKPARSGSSVGISKVAKADDFNAAIEKAFNTDNRILLDETIVVREIACGLYVKNSKPKQWEYQLVDYLI